MNRTLRSVIVAFLDAALLLASVPFLLFVSGVSVMAFDTPNSDKLWQPWLFVLTVWSMSVLLPVVSAVLAFRAWRKDRAAASLLWAGVPLLFLLAFFWVIQLV